MKRQLLNFFMLAFIFSTTMISCNQDDGPTSINPEKIVRFYSGEPEITVSETSEDLIELKVYANQTHDGPVTVYWEIEGDTDAVEVVSEQGKAVIAAGETTGTILLKPIDNDDINVPSNQVIVRVTGSDTDFAAPSGVSIGHAEKTIIFADNECPVDMSALTGTFSAIENNTYGPYTVTVAEDGEGGLIFSNLFDVGGTTPASLSTCEKTVTFGSSYLFTHPSYGAANLSDTPAYTSTYDDSAETLSLYFRVCVSAGCFTGFDGANNKIELTRQ